MIELTVDTFDKDSDKVVKYILDNPPKTNEEFKQYTKSFYGVELNCDVVVFPNSKSSNVSYKILEQEREYSKGALYQKWEEKYGKYQGLKVLLNLTFGELYCGGVANYHYGQTKLLNQAQLKALEDWDNVPNDTKQRLYMENQRQQLREIFGGVDVFGN